MFFMGEEIGAQKTYRFGGFMNNREDILVERSRNGKFIFRFYQEIISLSRRFSSIRSHNIDILHQSNSNRVIALKCCNGDEAVIVVASFNNSPFSNGYVIQKYLFGIPNASWKENLIAMLPYMMEII